MSRPRVSVVLPTYNGSRYLSEAIESCLGQTYSDWELIVVDDGSTDRSPSIIKEFEKRDSRIRSIRHATNKRLPAALNTGFASAVGSYHTWTSDDNLYRPTAFEKMTTFLESRLDIGLVYTDYSTIDESGHVDSTVTIDERRALLSHNAIGPSFMYRREVRESVGDYDEGLFLAEDYDFWLRMSVRFHFAPLHEDLYLYRRHQESLTSRRRLEADRLAEGALICHLPEINWANSLERAGACLRMALRAWRRKERTTALRRTATASRYALAALAEKLDGRPR